MKKTRNVVISILISLLLLSCNNTTKQANEENPPQESATPAYETEIITGAEKMPEDSIPPDKTEEPEYVYVNLEGETLETRINVPKGYSRTEVPEGSFAEFVRNYAMKPDASPVYLYDGSEKSNQNAHAAVFSMHLESRDLQQCADSVMRIYAEYWYQKADYEKISFHLVNGFTFGFDTWSKGHKLLLDGNTTSWGSQNSNDGSRKSFERYLTTLFAYASTLSMEQESEPANISDLQAGDIFIKGGSPGHVVMAADICVNEQGEKAFLLAQGYMPAQEFHILKNPLHDNDPWYYASEVTYPFRTPEYTFGEGSLKHPPYLISGD